MPDKFKNLTMLGQYVFWKSVLKLNKFHSPQMQLLNGNQTLNMLIDKKLSFARFGEGELRLAFCQGETIYEELNKEKAEKLRSIILNQNPSSTLIGFNNLFSERTYISWITNLMRVDKDYHSRKSIIEKNDITVLYRESLTNEYRAYLSLLGRFSNLKILGEASCFSLGTYVNEYSRGELDKIKELIVKVLSANKTLLVAPNFPRSGGISLFERLKNSPWNCGEVFKIDIPNQDAFRDYKNIYEDIGRHQDKVDLVIIQAGALATVLSYEIPKNFGIRTIDVGGFGV